MSMLAKSKKNIKHTLIKLLGILPLGVPSFAYAAAGDDAVTEMLRNVGNYLSGGPAIAVATLAIMGIGFMCMRGQIPIYKALCCLIGLGLVLSAGYLISIAYPQASYY